MHPIPSAAWSRPIGAPLLEAARAIEATPALIDDGPFQGLPLGGLGSGAIGRTYRGDFARWHLEIGTHRYQTAYANQFSLFVEQDGRRLAQVLWTERPPAVLQDWQWEYPRGAGTYHALFPRAWYVYDCDQLPARLSQEQFSPVIPGNERETSYPVAVFEWRVENPTPRAMRVGIMLTWENSLTCVSHTVSSSSNIHQARREAGLLGVDMRCARPFTAEPPDGSLAIVAPELPGVEVSYRSRFVVDERGADLWRDFAEDGRLDDPDDPCPRDDDRPIAAALAVTFDLQPGQEMLVPFALAWDLPVAAFPSGARWYKRYTRFFGRGGDNAWRIAAEAVRTYPVWRRAIETWQRPILDDPRRPDWYKTALFNELYYLVDGGTLWVDGPIDEHGQVDGEDSRFAYLECFDYPYYATHDVAFYSSWAVLQLWPNLERQEMLQFAATVRHADPTPIRIHTSGQIAPRKVAGALPHDLGAPTEDPFLKPNAYAFQDMNGWKDLNLKYVLRAYRDYVVLGDRDLLDQLWPTVPAALEYVRQFDADGDGLLDHHGADQTYDTWSMEGASAYTGGLLIATLEAACEMARLNDDTARLRDYQAWLGRARESFEARLWNGRYYDYDSGSPHHDSVMADQLAGQWYAGALGLPPIAPTAHVQRALRTVYECNVLRFANGAMGAVNGMRPDGTVDTSDRQAHEVWSGVTYALAALMLQERLEEEGWRTAWGAYNVTYVTHGLWFRTPEAWNENGTFRASMYMRPQAIWAIEHALKLYASGGRD